VPHPTFLRARFGELLVAVRRANAQTREAREERRGGAFAPLTVCHVDLGRRFSALTEMPAVAAQPCSDRRSRSSWPNEASDCIAAKDDRSRSQPLPFAEVNGEAAPGRVACDAATVDASADDGKVIGSRHHLLLGLCASGPQEPGYLWAYRGIS
jgi:hypothetical protein